MSNTQPTVTAPARSATPAELEQLWLQVRLAIDTKRAGA